MEKVILDQTAGIGMPLYDMRKLFNAKGDFTGATISHIVINPGQRVPTTGFSCHPDDEYSYIISGSLRSWNAGVESTIHPGDATLIPKGEEHWCETLTDEPCVLVCVMLGK